MKVLFDTNVVLDVLLDREPHAAVATQLLAAVERREVAGIIAATSLTTVDYLVRKVAGRQRAVGVVRALLQIFAVAQVDRATVESALDAGFLDFEIAVLHEAGRIAGAEALVTRNAGDFKAGRLLVHSPADLEALLRRRRDSRSASPP